MLDRLKQGVNNILDKFINMFGAMLYLKTLGLHSDTYKAYIYYYRHFKSECSHTSTFDIVIKKDERDVIHGYSDDVVGNKDIELTSAYLDILTKHPYRLMYKNIDTSIKGDSKVLEIRHYIQFETFCWVGSSEIGFCYSDKNTTLHDLFIAAKDRIIDNNTRSIYLLGSDVDGFLLSRSTINIMYKDLDINTNYNDSFVEKYDYLIESLRDDSSGLYILNGIHGSGKTTLIRHLIYMLNKRVIFIPTTMGERLSSPEVIPFLLKFPNSIIVLEDSEAILRDRVSSGGDGASVSNILNISDGILGDALKFKIICTFNADHQVIDKALSRKGRMKFRHEFDKLSLDKTNNLLTKLGHPKSTIPMLLSDIYNYEDDSNEQEKTPIGFK